MRSFSMENMEKTIIFIFLKIVVRLQQNSNSNEKSMDKKELLLMILNGLFIQVKKAPLSIEVGMKLSEKAIYRRILIIAKYVWVNRMYEKLSAYGISRLQCEFVGLNKINKAMDDMMDYKMNSSFKIEKYFPTVKNINHAANIYNAFLRHCRSNYDDFCHEVDKVTGNVRSFSKTEIRILWRKQCPQEFAEYEKKCLILDNIGRRDYSGHFWMGSLY